MPTEADIKLIADEVSSTIYVELIIADPVNENVDIVTTGCTPSSRSTFVIQRDLYDPALVPTIRFMLSNKGLKLSEYYIYDRNQRTGELMAIDTSLVPRIRQSIVAINKNLVSLIDRVGQYIASGDTILPARMI